SAPAPTGASPEWGPTPAAPPARRARIRRCAPGLARKPEREAGAAARFLCGGDFAAVGFDNRSTEGEAESHPARFGGDERVEYGARDLGLDPRTVVMDDDLHAIAGAADVRAKRTAAARGQGFDGVQVEVGE